MVKINKYHHAALVKTLSRLIQGEYKGLDREEVFRRLTEDKFLKGLKKIRFVNQEWWKTQCDVRKRKIRQVYTVEVIDGDDSWFPGSIDREWFDIAWDEINK